MFHCRSSTDGTSPGIRWCFHCHYNQSACLKTLPRHGRKLLCVGRNFLSELYHWCDDPECCRCVRRGDVARNSDRSCCHSCHCCRHLFRHEVSLHSFHWHCCSCTVIAARRQSLSLNPRCIAVNPNLSTQSHVTYRISQDHSLHQVWTLWDHSFLSSAPEFSVKMHLLILWPCTLTFDPKQYHF